MPRRWALAFVVVGLVLAASAAAGKPRLGVVPASCSGATELPMSTPPSPWPRLVGTDPLWLGIYAHVNQTRARVTVRQDRFYRRVKRRGWPVKVLWVVSRQQTEPITVSFRRVRTGHRVWIRLTGIYDKLARSPVLDPARPGHPDDPSKPNTHEWGSTVFFPRAGCYAFAARWSGGGAAFTFGFGRPRP